MLSVCFDKIAIYKPVTSRPANSVRYLVCKNALDNRKKMSYYFSSISEVISYNEDNNKHMRIQSLIKSIPYSFIDYIEQMSTLIAERQIEALKTIRYFALYPRIKKSNNYWIREACLNAWNIR